MQPTENVVQLALVSTVMPHTNRVTGNRYRWALAIAVVIVAVFTLTGLLPAAIVSAAFAVPIVYLLYLYDLNVWEDTPGPFVGLVIVLTLVLGALITLVFYEWVFDNQYFELAAKATLGQLNELPIGPFLIFVVLLPVVAEIAMNVGPVILARMPKFDDMIDGLTLGVAAGTAYAAAETIVSYRSVFSGPLHTTQGIGNWIPVILSLMIVKSLVYGTATGIAVAAFSGKGEGYDGFTGRYFRELLLAIVALVLYWGGVRLLAYADYGVWLGLIWGLIVLALLIVRIRVVLHTALLEAALEDAAASRRGKAAVVDGGWCPDCEMPLLPDALFCVACGQSVRATSQQVRRQLREPGIGGAA
ncbi:MAG TPA: zinc ribbon domain-containing protein [Acidimicrobiia bacterium]|nr:zinc ribbon domain-containing protein [Acidimicrobiia bacterium]